tara:strand:- start:3567 stop:4265 length:699 start_codon:yes stop_codon:yes gene_type:complete
MALLILRPNRPRKCPTGKLRARFFVNAQQENYGQGFDLKDEIMKYSTMTGKLKDIQALNTSPLDNPFCVGMSKKHGTICHECYSNNIINSYRANCRLPWYRNGLELSESAITNYPAVKTELFRINAHGELLNLNHARNILNLAKQYPDNVIGFWTKRHRLVQQAIELDGKPANVSLIKSSLKLNAPDKLPKYFDHVFTVYDHENNINCGAKDCNTCRECYTGKAIFINELLK